MDAMKLVEAAVPLDDPVNNLQPAARRDFVAEDSLEFRHAEPGKFCLGEMAQRRVLDAQDGVGHGPFEFLSMNELARVNPVKGRLPWLEGAQIRKRSYILL